MTEREHPLDIRPELEALRQNDQQERWMVAKFMEASPTLDGEPTPAVHVQGPDTSSHGMEVVPIEDLADARRERDSWVRLFNRLQGAVQHHRNADRFKDDHDEALYASMDRVLRDAAKGDT